MSRAYPTPTKRRRSSITLPASVTVSYKKGDDSKDQGDRAVVKPRMPKMMSMAEKFAAKADASNIYTTITRFTYLRQSVLDRWGVQQTDSSGYFMEFFTPRKFKDVEAVAVNSKALSSASYITQTVAANGETMQEMYIDYSHVRFVLTNITQRRCVVQMYVLYGKNEPTNNPIDDVAAVYDMLQGNSSSIDFSTPYQDLLSNKEFCSRWDVTKVEFRLEQGEHQTYLLKGPKKYVLDPKKHLPMSTTNASPNPTWFLPSQKGNGCYVMFRMINDLCLVGNNDAGSVANPLMGGRKIGAHHPITPVPSTDGAQQGAVVVRYSEYYAMKKPSPADIDGTLDSRFFLNDFHTLAGSTYTEINVDSDQAMTVPASFL